MNIYPWQENIWRQLVSQLRGWPNAFLLKGRSGIGKLVFARAMSQYLLCEARRLPSLAACGKCQGCLWFANGNHPDFRLLRLYPALVEQCHSIGLRVFPWTVDHPHVWDTLVNNLHVDGVITNDPGKLYDWLLAQTKTNGTDRVA